MTTVGVIGQAGTGKTLYITAMGKLAYETGIQQELLGLEPTRVVSNYWLAFPHTKVDIYGMIDIINEDNTQPTVLLIQEASKWFDARRSSREENVLLTSLTGQQRKRDMDIFYDDQFMSRIDLGLRDITHQSFISNANPAYPEKPIVFEYEQYYGYFKAPTGKTLRFPAFFMEQFYEDYNTKEVTPPHIPIKKKK